MTMYPTKAPHITGARDPLNVAPNAALLIDFDNVTMGMRSDLSKELKNLLNSDIIKGKVTVQRAYADWRRYPQYIVPLSEASIDLIFAPAYGSNKKNATDIRMAIDGIELVFIRPEIGTFILLTGDSDFSSLVLKLKEYGKYVIGVGIQESSSDILVQNCDEYYSYTSLSGLRKTTDSDRQPIDPWVLVERAVEQMAAHDDVMRSDRLKQVMVELDPGFDEGEYGFSKFSRFLTEASSKGLLHLKKLDNGQFEVAPSGRRSVAPVEERVERPAREERSRGRGGRGRERERDEERRPRGRPSDERGAESRDEPRTRREREESVAPVAEGPPLKAAYDLLTRALERMLADGREAVRDSDVKRKMLELDQKFDESELGFSKFSRFLSQAHEHDVIELHKRDNGNFEVSLRKDTGRSGAAAPRAAPVEAPRASAPRAAPPARPPQPAPEPPESMLTALGRRFGFLPPKPQPQAAPPAPSPPPPPVVQPRPEPGEERPVARSSSSGAGRGAGPRDGGARERRPRDSSSRETRRDAGRRESAQRDSGRRESAPRESTSPDSTRRESEPTEPKVDAAELGLPTETDEQVRYLTTSYKGVGKKTAEKLVEGFGGELFTVLQKEPERVQDVIPTARAETVLEQWKEDYDRRRSRLESGPEPAPGAEGEPSELGAAADARTEVEPTREERIYATAERETAPRPAEAVAAASDFGGQPPREEPEPAEPARAEAPTAPAEAAPARPEEPGSELEGLEPSRLRGRTTRGRRR